jgi:MoxR-like ATPase
MNFPFIDGSAKQSPGKPMELPIPDHARERDPAAYIADESLIDAVNVALLLGQPLLLTGEPGTGKTELAYRLAWELGLGKPLAFNTKSTSTARDLFYTFDAMGRFQVAHTGNGSDNNLDYIVYNAIGLAILRSREEVSVSKLLPPCFEHGGRRQSVVLVDEIDKAPRDFPNDLLHEVESLSFRIPELGNIEVQADAALRPILVLTSNSEKNLPDAFLRRCVFYNIPFPKTGRLIEIVRARTAAFKSDSIPPTGPAGSTRAEEPTKTASPLLKTAVALFEEIRSSGLRKPPSTAELLNWVQALIAKGAVVTRPIEALGEKALMSTSCVLAKTRDDAEALERFLKKKLSV